MKIGPCSVCNQNTELRVGMCIPHYSANWKQEMRKVKCKMDGCNNGVKARMVCDTHFRKLRRYELHQKRVAIEQKKQLFVQKVQYLSVEERERIVSVLEFVDGWRDVDCAYVVSVIRGETIDRKEKY